ncbi:MAG: nuclear transport factor 2 family protein [Candidatus Eremiobacteraeota bacterium]|nr:nuclear transport factor 2 family protein [Candidatus Eremiobacteraeota bacterium]
MIIRALALAVLSVSFALPVAAADTNAGVMHALKGVLAAVNADNATQLNAYFASNATVVDDFPPFAWMGADAGTRWWHASDKDLADHGIAGVHATLGAIARFAVIGNDAYVIAPLTIAYRVKGRPAHSNGLWTLTFHQSGGTWKIASATWTTSSSI